MADPPLDGVSIRDAGDYCPGINVHFSSGVFNKAFYLLVNTPDWDIWMAFHVFVMANRWVGAWVGWGGAGWGEVG